MLSKNAVLTRTRKGIDLYEFDYNMNIDGILTAQGYGQIWSHIDCVNRYKVKLFIELGMYMGGTLPYLIPNLVLDHSFSYLGFEKIENTVNGRLITFSNQNPRCRIILDDMFSPPSMGIIAKSVVNTHGAVYIFCDGGNKPKELMTFSRIMRVGDIISVHDYTEDQTGEIRDADLAKLGDDFVPLDENWRHNLLWLPTFIKVK